MQCKMYSTQLEPSGQGTAENKFNAFVTWSYTAIPDMECGDKKDQSQQSYLKKLIPVFCHWGCKQHLHIVVSNAIEQHFLYVPAGLSQRGMMSLY